MKSRNFLYGCALVVPLLLTVSCGQKRPNADADDETTSATEEEEWNINGGDTDQPIIDGWTFEMAAEFYLANQLDNEYSRVVRGESDGLTPDSLARLTKGHVRVKIPVQQQDAKPRFEVTYRQPETGGTISFRDSPSRQPTRYGDTLQAIGEATFQFKDALYDYQTESFTAYVQSRGKGIYTLFRMEGSRDPDTKEWRDHSNPAWYPVIISVYPQGDSLVISRGMSALETFVPQR